jgi:type I restriction enzyme S subunit
MSAWPVVALEDVFAVSRGGSPRPIDNFITDDPGGVNWIMIGDASEGSKYISSTKKRIIKEGVKKSRMVSAGDFLLTNSMSFGKPYILKTSGCIHDGWLVLSPRHDQIHSDFFYYLLGSDLVYSNFKKLAAGAVVKNLNSELVRGVQIPLPPLAEQKRIAAILDAADALRTKRREALVQLDALLQSTFLTLFGDPVANPMGWNVQPLGDFCKTGTGGTPSRSKIERYYEGGTIPWVKSGELRENTITQTSEHVTATALEETNVKLVPKDAILLALYGATVGRLGILGIEATTNQAVCHIIPNQQRANLTYMFHALSNQVSYLIGRGVGGAQPNISQGIVKALEIPLPPLPLQQKFAAIVESVERQKAAQRAHLAELDALFAALQHRAFRGEM